MSRKLNSCNQFTEFQNKRKCQYDKCQNEFDYRESGKGTQKYCKNCVILVRAESKRRNNRAAKFREIKINLVKNYIYFMGGIKK